jgi:hypothetical protein
MVKFFTAPPRPWPYLLINANRPDLRYLEHAREVWIDGGVEIFRDPSVKDYPRGHLERVVGLYLKVRERVGPIPIHVSTLDYCDDYNPRSLWISDEVTNIERTVESAVRCVERYPWVPWVPVVQGWYRRPESVLRCIELYEERGMLDEFDCFAVGNLCTEREPHVAYRALVLVRKKLPDRKIHVFGLHLRALRFVYRLIDSFDSLAWAKAVERSLKYPNDNYMPKNRRDRVRYFDAWLKKLERIAEEVERCLTLEGFVGRGP